VAPIHALMVPNGCSTVLAAHPHLVGAAVEPVQCIGISMPPISAMPVEPIGIYSGTSLRTPSRRSRFGAPMKVLRLCAMAFMVWCDLWQWIAQWPGSSVVTSGRRAPDGTQPPSMQVTSNGSPCLWMG
jgi:hypothetical protein